MFAGFAALLICAGLPLKESLIPQNRFKGHLLEAFREYPSLIKNKRFVTTAVKSINVQPPINAAFLRMSNFRAVMAPHAMNIALNPIKRPKSSSDHPKWSCIIKGADEQ